MKHDAIIFDMDGTLLDTLGDLHNAVNQIMRAYGYPERTVDEVRAFVGNGVKLLVDRALPEGVDAQTAESALRDFKVYYSLHNLEKTGVYEGVPQLIDRLYSEGVPMAIVSNKVDPAVKQLTEIFFPGKIGAAIGEKAGIKRKPEPDSVFEAMRLLNSKNPVYVGDSEVDVETAKNAGIDGVFVTWGFRGREWLTDCGAKVIVDTAEELYKEL